MFEKYIKNEVRYNIENIINDIVNYQEDKETTEKIEKLTESDEEKITKRLVNDEAFVNYFNELVNSEIVNEIYHYVKEAK